jgi:hypothetical protein
MMTNPGGNGTGFRMRRPRVTTSGFVADLDPIVKSHLDELNALLSKPVFARGEPTYDGPFVEDRGEPPGLPGDADTAVLRSSGKKGETRRPAPLTDVQRMLARKLTPKQVPANKWQDTSLAAALSAAKSDPAGSITLTEHIDATPELSKLKYAFTGHLRANEFTLEPNLKLVLVGYPAIVDFLVAYGYYELRLQTARTLIEVLQSSPKGAQTIVNYAAVSGARSRIVKEQLAVSDYNNDDGQLVKALLQADLPLSEVAFSKAADQVIDNFIFNSEQEKLITSAEADLGQIPPALRAQLVRSIKTSAFPLTAQNAKFFVSQFIMQHTSPVDDGLAPFEQEEASADAAGDFDVTYLADDRELVQVSQSAVKCAAQLFYSMVLGDELNVFDVVNYFTHRYLVRGDVDITKRALRNDLEMYVFNGKFAELDKEGRPTNRPLLDRTRPAERHMFYRQVFNYGSGPVTDDVLVNADFKRLWNVLMLESARYLERAQLSPHPDSFVSRTNVMQAVEDLQYNLSTNCTGMATVISPLIYKELDFVTRRIFMNKEVLANVAPGAGSWMRVVEKLSRQMKPSRPKATALYNKAKLGHMIIQSIASYNPATFEDDQIFSEFISSVDAFITTQSILQESLTDDLRKGAAAADDDDMAAVDGDVGPSVNGTGTNGHAYLPEPASGGAAAQDEWDF